MAERGPTGFVSVSLDSGENNDDKGKREEDLEWSPGQAKEGASGRSLGGLSSKVIQGSRAGEQGNEVLGAFRNFLMPASSFLSHLGGKVIWQVSEGEESQELGECKHVD